MRKLLAVSLGLIGTLFAVTPKVEAVGSACCNSDGTSCTDCAGTNCTGCSNCSICAGGTDCGSVMACCNPDTCACTNNVYEGCCRGMGLTPVSSCSSCLCLTDQDQPPAPVPADSPQRPTVTPASKPMALGLVALIGGAFIASKLFIRLRS